MNYSCMEFSSKSNWLLKTIPPLSFGPCGARLIIAPFRCHWAWGLPSKWQFQVSFPHSFQVVCFVYPPLLFSSLSLGLSDLCVCVAVAVGKLIFGGASHPFDAVKVKACVMSQLKRGMTTVPGSHMLQVPICAPYWYCVHTFSSTKEPTYAPLITQGEELGTV